MPIYKPTPKQVGRVAGRRLKQAVNPRPVPRIQQPKVTWGGQTFSTPQGLTSWIRQRRPGFNEPKFWEQHPGVRSQFGMPAPPTPTPAAAAASVPVDPTQPPLPASQAPPVAPPLPPPPGQTSGPLQWNPQLPSHPLNEYTDAQYEADEAGLKSEFTPQYQEILQQLGFMSPEGQFVRGSLELEAEQRRADLNREMGLAKEEATNVERERGTLFSGVRGTNLARAEHPYVTELSDIDIELPKAQTGLYNQALGMIGNYGMGHYQNILDAITRFKPSDKGGWEQPKVPAAKPKAPPKPVAKKKPKPKAKKVPYKLKGKKPSPRHLTG